MTSSEVETKKLAFNDYFNSKRLNSQICFEHLMMHLAIKCFGIIRYSAINSKEKLTFSQRGLHYTFLVVDKSTRKKTSMRSLSLIENVTSGRPRSRDRRAW